MALGARGRHAVLVFGLPHAFLQVLLCGMALNPLKFQERTLHLDGA